MASPSVKASSDGENQRKLRALFEKLNIHVQNSPEQRSKKYTWNMPSDYTKNIGTIGASLYE